MSEIAPPPPETLAAQHSASDPAASVWVSANAGSGKTHVLTQRVVRLLLKGVPPSKILCLTFTKAAAANMATRVFDMLALWTRLSDADLRAAIAATGAPAPRARDLGQARTLFARTVETPGGLKIQTIHAFCEMLLHVFPFEANVSARFEVADDLRRAELLARARREGLAAALRDPRGLGAHVAELSDQCSAQTFEKLIKEAMSHCGAPGAFWREDHEPALRKALDLAAGRDAAAIARDMIEGGLAPALWEDVARWLGEGGVTDGKRAQGFRDAARRLGEAGFAACLAVYLAIFFKDGGNGEALQKLASKDLATKRPDLAAMLYDEQARLTPLREERKAFATLARTLSLAGAVDAVLSRYGAMKAAAGILDFDDLVERALALLERSDAAWVLFKLDSGIDHILVDEAQDTSAAQWRILERLTSDFGAAGRNGGARTFFAVGDEKQSIFSFQGAAPHMFAQMLRTFRTRFREGEQPFSHVRLGLSFRSSPGILAAVDKVFERAEHQSGLVALDDLWMPHEAMKRKLPGLVEIWPFVGAPSREDARDWRLPLDILDPQDPATLVAQRVAQKIARLTAQESGESVFDARENRARPARAGDVMILVRRRGPFFEAVIRALKQCNVPVAGADRLELANHIAVMDLIAAGRAALLPQDDLTLACVLKSPLMNLDDDDLLRLAPDRSGALFDALKLSQEPKHAAAFARLMKWRARAALSPFSFYSSLLSEDGGRRAIEARLGPEASDAVDEFLRLAISYELEAAPSLVNFLHGFEGMDWSIKRDMESGADAVRVMTVHAAKGLEAKIVFLPDTCAAPSGRHDPKFFELDAGPDFGPVLAWSPRKELDCPATAAARTRARADALEEYRRLLYVALTRAEERLYIAGFHGAQDPAADCWAQMIRSTLGCEDGVELIPAFWDPEDKIMRLAHGSAPPSARPSEPDAAPADPPDWLAQAAPAEPAPAPSLRPSRALASTSASANAATTKTGRRRALEHGRLTHALLQYLPDVTPNLRAEAARRYLEAEGCLGAEAGGLGDAARESLADKVLAVLGMPLLADLFAPGSKAEVAVEGTLALPGGRRIDVAGQIDRIAVTSDAVLVADFKTGSAPEAGAPSDYLVQMALYRAVLAPLWPGRPVRMMLVWTDEPRVEPLDDAALDAALALIDAGARAATA